MKLLLLRVLKSMLYFSYSIKLNIRILVNYQIPNYKVSL